MLPVGLVEDWLGLTDEAEIALAEDAADRALTWIETQAGRHFREPRGFSLRFDGGRQTFWLPEIPITDTGESDGVDQLWVHQKNAAGEWELIDEADYELIVPDFAYEMPTLEWLGSSSNYWPGCWPRDRRNIRVTFTAGYEVGELPGDIEQLVLDMVSAWWHDRGREGLKKEELDGYSYERWATGDGARFAEDWKASLTKWKHPVMGRA